MMDSLEGSIANATTPQISRIYQQKSVNSDLSQICVTIDELTLALRNQLGKASQGLIPECTHCEFIFPEVFKHGPSSANGTSDSAPDPSSALNVSKALCRGVEPKEKMRRQRIISRAIVEEISKVDSFCYVKRNASISRNDEGCRFMFVCRDSFQNRDRIANRTRAADIATPNTPTRATKKHPDKTLEKKREPTYDCGGSIRVNFFVKNPHIAVTYKHTPLHRTHIGKPPVHAARPTNGVTANRTDASASETGLEGPALAVHGQTNTGASDQRINIQG